MHWKRVIAGVGLGFMAGLYFQKQLNQDFISSEKALHIAKQANKDGGQISGSWIHVNPEKFISNSQSYMVYKGGITKSENGETKQIEFMVDAESGHILG